MRPVDEVPVVSSCDFTRLVSLYPGCLEPNRNERHQTGFRRGSRFEPRVTSMTTDHMPFRQ